jgi:hypothetical protein
MSYKITVILLKVALNTIVSFHKTKTYDLSLVNLMKVKYDSLP